MIAANQTIHLQEMEHSMSVNPEHRPLSPHLQIYRPQISSVLSIFHRITGTALSAGTLLLVAWLWAAAYDEALYGTLQLAAGHWLGTILLVGWTYALFYHLCNGIRHLFWDIGKGFELDTMAKSGIATVVCSVIFTGATWIAVCNQLNY